MGVTQTGTTGTTQVTSPNVPFAFDAARFDAAMARLGHTSETGRAEAAGLTRMTLSRWRRARFSTLPRHAMQAAQAAGMTVEELFVPKPGLKTIDERVAELLADEEPLTAEQHETIVRILARVPAQQERAA